VEVRDRLGQWLADEDFAAASGIGGRPGWAPSRLALVTVLQRAEKRTDRLAAEAVRARLDWKYLPGLPLEDPGFDHTVLAEFPGQGGGGGAGAGGAGRAAGQAGRRWPGQGGREAAHRLHARDRGGGGAEPAGAGRGERAGRGGGPGRGAPRLAGAADLGERLDPPLRHPDDRLAAPGLAGEQDELAIAYAREGYALPEAVYGPSSPPWLRELPAVEVLRRVLVQNCTRAITGTGREVIKRREKEPEGGGLPPGHARIASPYDTGARRGVKREESWPGCTLHVTRTCDDEPACGCPGDGGTGRRHDQDCAAPAFPDLITHVATTDATVTGSQMTAVIDDDLAGKTPTPGRHYLDSGYLSAALVVAGAARHGTALTGPLPAGTSAQARAGHGYARADFTAGYDSKTVTCPQGKTSVSWTPCAQRGKDAIAAAFSAAGRGPCPARPPCTTSSKKRRQLTVLPGDLAGGPGRSPDCGNHDPVPG
jgi:Transposase domain (DUF772)